MNKLDTKIRARIIASLVEGNSLRATAGMVDVAFNTVLKLVLQIVKACAEYQDRVLRNLPSMRIQCDEIWSFCYAKEKNLSKRNRVNMVMGMFGLGLRWMQILSWFLVGWSGGALRNTQSCLLKI